MRRKTGKQQKGRKIQIKIDSDGLSYAVVNRVHVRAH